ncbi:DUF559 domain-containing protein [Aquihabitans sp. G128]|uniref:type IV toxin-antitoxin system AbiEi family antitoxin domain-containing protein n=1 Tax=Aquihabitans sp. G128 TaxID=2849779 RepID=UPI001C234514|nr:type IV toxin-antitoxin system AbiEi family antitoxin domain-containing protein [Aquihabitans sp. G128]QXC61033.1 DUF559 domain-containing protein [Aquihabitans sp. G128]
MAAIYDQLAGVARGHHGVFTTEHAVELGISERMLRRLTATGWCDRPWRGIYRLRGAPDSTDQALQVAVWFGGDDAVASHRSAAQLWGLPGFAGAPPEVTKPRGQSQRRPYGSFHGSLALPPAHTTTRRGIAVTTPARTIFDLAGVVRPGRVERALDHSLNEELCTVTGLHQVFFALARRGRRGTVVMRQLLDARGVGYVATASELEREGRRVFREAGLPAPAFEVDLGSEAWIGRVDAVWRAARVVVELDSRKHHTQLLDRDSDRRRDNELMSAGWRVIRVTWDDLRDRPDQVVRWIRKALASSLAA